MNYFTLEKLKDLNDCCDSGIHDDHPLENWKVSLQVKLQSLIDNYDAIVIPVWHREKCGHVQ